MRNYLNCKNEIDYIRLKEIGKQISNGKIVVFPTETVYGIGTNGLDKNAVRRLYEVKKRPSNKPISLLVSNMEMIKQVTKGVTELEYALMKEFFPGPLTIILKKKEIVPNILTASSDTVGIRMPENEIALKLIEYAGVPISTSSANISGKQSGINLENIMTEFGGKVDYFIDDGISEIGYASTIVQVINGKPNILRKGYISEEEIKLVSNKYI